MTEQKQQMREQWLARLNKELKGQEAEKMESSIHAGLRAHILPRVHDHYDIEAKDIVSPLLGAECYHISNNNLEELNQFVLSGLSRGTQHIVLAAPSDPAIVDVILDGVRRELIHCWSMIDRQDGYSIYRDLNSSRRSIGLQAKSTENYIESDAKILHAVIHALEQDSRHDHILLQVNFSDRFDLNVMRLAGLRVCIDHLQAATDRKIDFHIMGNFLMHHSTASMDDTLISAATKCLSASLSGADCFCIEFSEDHVKRAWPQKYLRALRSIPLLLQHESELEGDRFISDGAHYIESLKNQYVEQVWSTLQDKIKKADS